MRLSGLVDLGVAQRSSEEFGGALRSSEELDGIQEFRLLNLNGIDKWQP